MTYASQVWSQSLKSVMNKISLIQKKAVRLMTFSNYRDHTEPIFKLLRILKFKDNLFLQNCLFVHDYLHGHLPDCFEKTFTKADFHNINTRHADQGSLMVPSVNSTTYGLKSIYKQCIDNWNQLIKLQKHNNIDVHLLSRDQLKKLITDYFIASYD